MKNALDAFVVGFIAMLVVLIMVLIAFLPLLLFIFTRSLKWFLLYLLVAPFVAGIMNVIREI